MNALIVLILNVLMFGAMFMAMYLFNVEDSFSWHFNGGLAVGTTISNLLWSLFSR